MPPTYALQTASGQRLVVQGDRIAPRETPAPALLDAGAVELRPGLINAHDHLHRNHYPRVGSPPYPNAYCWGEDLQARYRAELDRAKRLPRGEALLFGALKNLLGGVTAVVHHDPWDPLLEDPDFPVRVVRVRVAHSLRFERDWTAALAGDPGTRDRPLSFHLAEGTDRSSAEEVLESWDRGLLGPHALVVHAVGVDARGIACLRRAGCGVVWCPSSNAFLFGRTAPAELLQSGLDILLGTDALLTADGTMLHELAAARRTGAVPEPVLLRAVGETAARRLGLPPPSLAPGRPADFIASPVPLLEARPRDLSLVVVGGRPRLADQRFAALFALLGIQTEPLVVGGVPKLVAAPLARVAERCCAVTPEVARILQ